MLTRIKPLRFIKDLRSDEQGATAVVFALMLPIIIGGLALGAESGYWLMLKSNLQNAADVSAHSVGVNMRKGASDNDLKRIAVLIAEGSGFRSDLGELEVNIPPRNGEFKGSRDHAEIVLTEWHERLFSSFFSKTPVEIGARATVTISGGTPLCVLSLAPNGRNALEVGAFSELTGEGCGVASNSVALTSISGIFGVSKITAECVQSAGNISGIISYDFKPCNAELRYAAPISDPYLTFDEIDATKIPCSAFPSMTGRDEVNVTPSFFINGTPVSKFCESLNFRGSVTFAPGVYVFEGGNLYIGGGVTVTGNQVSFFLNRGASLRVSGATLDLSAPTSGPHKGLVLTNNRNDDVGQSIILSNSSRLAGALYFPGSTVTIAGGGSHCGQLIAAFIRISGDTSFNPNCVAGQKNVMAGETVSVVE